MSMWRSGDNFISESKSSFCLWFETEPFVAWDCLQVVCDGWTVSFQRYTYLSASPWLQTYTNVPDFYADPRD